MVWEFNLESELLERGNTYDDFFPLHFVLWLKRKNPGEIVSRFVL